MSRFTSGEIKVMRILWEHGELKLAELQAQFPEPIKNPALRSYLTTLVEKRPCDPASRGKGLLLQGRDPIAVGVSNDARRAG